MTRSRASAGPIDHIKPDTKSPFVRFASERLLLGSNLSTRIDARECYSDAMIFAASPKGDVSGVRAACHGWLWATIACVVGMVIVLATWRDYGVTWDEGAQAYYGRLSLDKLLHRPLPPETQDFLTRTFGFTYYGPLLEMIPAAIHGPDERELYNVRHLFFGLLALLAIPAMHALLGKVGGAALAAFATLALIVMPGFFGHCFNNSKDPPFAIAVIGFMAAALWLAQSPTLQWRRVIVCGVALGVALCVRPGGLPLLAIYLAGISLLAQRSGEGMDVFRSGVTSLLDALIKFAVILVIGWIIMVLPWSWAHSDPLMHPIRAIQYSMNYRRNIPVLFEGQSISSSSLPWHYLPKMLLITTPLPILGLALLGVAASVREQFRDSGSRCALMCGVLQLWLAAPLAMFIIQRPAVYDGIRHFMFVLPAIAAFAGIGVTAIVKWPQRRWLRFAAGAAMTAVMLWPVIDLVRLHPYQSTYYNELVGGVAGASGKYETDYWVASYREAIHWVNTQVAKRPEHTTRVLVAGPQYIYPAAGNDCASNVQIEMYHPDPRHRTLPPIVDYYIASTRFGYDQKGFVDDPVVHTVGRAGAVFTVIKSHGPQP